MKQTQKLAELAAKIEIVPAEVESAEQQLGFTAEEAATLKEGWDDAPIYNNPADSDSELVIDDLPPHRAITVGELRARTENEQSPESASLDADIASGGSNRVAVIPVVDRVVDPVVTHEPIDIRIGGNHYQLPGRG
jgi:hypothetical protein